jgi:hypothetical protein
MAAPLPSAKNGGPRRTQNARPGLRSTVRASAFRRMARRGRLVRREVASWVATITAPQDPFRREVFTLDSGADRLELLCPACAAAVDDAAPTVLFDARGYVQSLRPDSGGARAVAARDEPLIRRAGSERLVRRASEGRL